MWSYIAHFLMCWTSCTFSFLCLAILTQKVHLHVFINIRPPKGGGCNPLQPPLWFFFKTFWQPNGYISIYVILTLQRIVSQVCIKIWGRRIDLYGGAVKVFGRGGNGIDETPLILILPITKISDKINACNLVCGLELAFPCKPILPKIPWKSHVSTVFSQKPLHT